MKKIILLLVGYLSVVLGIIGIFAPLLPTTPFLLLAAACFIRSSKKAHNWLLSNKLFGMHLKNYQRGEGVKLAIKVGSILFLWGTILYSIFFIVEEIIVVILLLIIAVSVTIHILLLKTLKE